MSICGIFVVSFTIYTLFIVYMDTKLISLKDFEISPNENVIERSQNFQSYIDQMDQFGCKSYWVMARTGVGARCRSRAMTVRFPHTFLMITLVCRKGLRPRRLV